MKLNNSNGKIQLDSTLPLSIESVQLACGATKVNAEKYIEFLRGACKAFDINTELRLAAFFAQIGHESAGLSRTVENLNYSKEGLLRVFPKYFTNETAVNYAHKPVSIANRVYANRMGNGDEQSGDGYKFRGRGFIQLTGKNNYKKISEYFGEDFVAKPDLLLEPVWMALAAAWFWYSKGLNDLADNKDTLVITKRINGGTHGLLDRTNRYDMASAALSGTDAIIASTQDLNGSKLV